jgi:hypothetical protein
MAYSHQAGIEWALTPQNWSGRVEVPGGVPRRVGTCCIVDDWEAETGGRGGAADPAPERPQDRRRDRTGQVEPAELDQPRTSSTTPTGEASS